LISDLYDTKNVEDLRAFYDYFMKNIKNDWVYTPRVRLSILNAGGDDIVNRPEETFPLSRQQSFKLYLDPTNLSLSSNATTASDTIAYDAVEGSVVFTLKPISRMEFTGYSKLRVWMSASDSNDMDIYIILQKYDSSTNKLLESPLVDVGRHEADPDQARSSLIRQHEADPSFCEGYFASGPTGCLRASHRELDQSKSSDFEPVYQHKREQLLEKDEVVPLDIALWPYGMICEKGQELRLTISGVNPRPHLRPSDPRPKLRNKGEHRLHFGDERESFLLLPLIPSE
jgi:predicted acyl esterase